MRPILLIAWVALATPTSALTTAAGAQEHATTADTSAIIRSVIEHLRTDFPRDSIVIDTRSASGVRLPIESLASIVGARLGQKEDVVRCRGESPDTCHVSARLFFRIDSVSIGGAAADVFVHFWTPSTSTLMPVAQVMRRFYVERRGGKWEFTRADRRVRVSDVAPTHLLNVAVRLRIDLSQKMRMADEEPLARVVD